jgi:hypothetical protein
MKEEAVVQTGKQKQEEMDGGASIYPCIDPWRMAVCIYEVKRRRKRWCKQGRKSKKKGRRINLSMYLSLSMANAVCIYEVK